MTKILIDEATVRLALEALEELTDTEQMYGALERGDTAITALREALAAQPAQQEIDWKDQYEKQKRRADMWVAKYEADIGPLEKAGPVAEQPAPQEPVAYIEHDDETAEPCPSCGKPLQSASGGGVVCSGRCGYWFCF